MMGGTTMENRYFVREWYGKYIVCKASPGSVKTWHIRSIRNGNIAWTSDPTYARSYCYTTAMRYLKDLRRGYM